MFEFAVSKSVQAPSFQRASPPPCVPNQTDPSGSFKREITVSLGSGELDMRKEVQVAPSKRATPPPNVPSHVPRPESGRMESTQSCGSPEFVEFHTTHSAG